MQKAGAIHSRAWIPQSNHMALFTSSLLPDSCSMKIDNETIVIISIVDVSEKCIQRTLRSLVNQSLTQWVYLYNIEWPLLRRWPNKNNFHHVWMILVGLIYPVIDLREKSMYCKFTVIFSKMNAKVEVNNFFFVNLHLLRNDISRRTRLHSGDLMYRFWSASQPVLVCFPKELCTHIKNQIWDLKINQLLFNMQTSDKSGT